MSAPRDFASRSAQATVGGGSSSGHSITCAQAKSSRRAATISTLTRWLAPGATAIWLRPSGSTTMSAVPVAASAVENSPATPMPSAARRARMAVPAASSPTHPMNRTSAPEPPRRHRLVGALAAVVDQQGAARHRLPGRGQARRGHDVVDVGGPHHEHARRTHARDGTTARRDARPVERCAGERGRPGATRAPEAPRTGLSSRREPAEAGGNRGRHGSAGAPSAGGWGAREAPHVTRTARRRRARGSCAAAGPP